MSKFMVRGSVQELERLNLPLNSTPSCSKRSVDGNEVLILGCPVYRLCKASDVPEKTSGIGPRNKGVRMLKKTADGRTRILHTCLTCYDIPHQRAQLEANGGLLQVIADEGDEILMKGSETIQDVIPGQGVGWRTDDYARYMQVKPFPRPGTGQNLSEEVGSAEIAAQMREDVMSARVAQSVGLAAAQAGESGHVRRKKTQAPKPAEGDGGAA